MEKAVLLYELSLEGLGATYDVNVRFIGKRGVDFLLVFIELFSLGVMAVALRENSDLKSGFSLQQDLFGPKFQVEWVPTTKHSFVTKLG